MKKTISVLLALVLTVGLFSACSKDGKEETTTAAPAAYTLAYTYDSHYAQTDPSAVRAYEKIAKAIAEGGVAVRLITVHTGEAQARLGCGLSPAVAAAVGPACDRVLAAAELHLTAKAACR